MRALLIVFALFTLIIQNVTAQQVLTTESHNPTQVATLDAFLALNAHMPKNPEMIAYFDFAKLARSGAFAKAVKSFKPNGAAKLMPSDLDFQFMLAVKKLADPEPVAAFYASEWINIEGMLAAAQRRGENKQAFTFQGVPMYVAEGAYIASPAAHVFIVGDDMRAVYRSAKLKPEQCGGIESPQNHLLRFDDHTFAYLYAGTDASTNQMMVMAGRCDDTKVVIDFQIQPVSDTEVTLLQNQVAELVGTLAVRLEEAMGVPGAAYDLAARVRTSGGNGSFHINITLPAELFEKYIPKLKLNALTGITN